MYSLRRIALLLVLFAVAAPLALRAQEQDRPVDRRLQEYLSEKSVAEGAAAFSEALESDPQNADLRFALGFLQFVGTVEDFGQACRRYGLLSNSEVVQATPFMRLPIFGNEAPEEIGYEDLREVFSGLLAGLTEAEATLAAIEDENVRLRVRPGLAYLDFNEDGEGAPEETLWRIYAGLSGSPELTAEKAATFVVDLDAGDVLWLRGYCHFLSAGLEFYLAHDALRLFEHTAHLYFARPKNAPDFLTDRPEGDSRIYEILDAVAVLHLINWPVEEPDRMRASHEHLQRMIALSRQTWDLYEKETDNRNEWIPNANQTSVLPGMGVTEEMIVQWRAFLDEADAILAGDLLIPFWRGAEPLGVNIRRAFTEPTPFDLVLWVQGSAAAPYVEEGKLTQGEFWERLMDSYGGGFVAFAVWFN